MIRITGAALAAGLALGGWSGAEAAIIDLSGVISDATLTSGLTGPLTPIFATDRYQASIDIENDAVASLSITMPDLTFRFQNCGQPDSSCGDRVLTRKSVAAAGDGSYYIQHYMDLGPLATFSVFLPSFGTATGYFEKDGSAGRIDVNLLTFAIARADNTGSLSAVLLVHPVPLPASLPMFGAALLGLGALAWRHRVRGAR